jgi:DNA integrity scanning protein DisA with diadenylate cyclase activity
VLLAISDMRRGTLILIPDDEERLPPTAGHIDNSKIGRTLYQLLQGQLISTLRTRQAAVGMLTSDGLTTIARSGCVLNCGEIVHMGEVDDTLRQAGGGRTQAAIAASRYGLVIKISEDGPISFYKDGREEISIVF